MEYLPEFSNNLPYINHNEYNLNVVLEYQNFLTNLEFYINHTNAILMNNNIIFNDYEPYAPIKSMINNIVKNNIINNPTIWIIYLLLLIIL